MKAYVVGSDMSLDEMQTSLDKAIVFAKDNYGLEDGDIVYSVEEIGSVETKFILKDKKKHGGKGG